jgi:protein PET117
MASNNSLKPQLTLFAAFVLTVGTVAYVHYAQQLERARLRAGVERDIERQRLKKLKEQKELLEG